MNKIIGRLKVHPELWGGSKRLREKPRGIRGNRPSTIHDLVNAFEAYSEMTGEFDLANAHRLEELFKQHLARVRWAERELRLELFYGKGSL